MAKLVLDMSFKGSDNDKFLSQELSSPNPSEENIREYVAGGANISGDFLYWQMMTNCYSPKQHERKNKSLTIELIKLLIGLGADVKYRRDGGHDCLYPAILSWQPELVELLLANGANPNTIEENESILVYAIGEELYAKHEAEEEMKQFVEIIKKHGGKRTNEI